MAEARGALAILAVAYFALGAVGMSVIGLIPPMAEGLGASVAATAGLVTVFALVYAVAGPLVQAWFGHWPRRTLIGAGLGLMAAGCFAAAAAPTLGWAMAARVAMALGAAMLGPTASAAAADLVPPDRRSAALATVFGGMTAATVLGIPLAAWLGQTVGWRWAWVAVGALPALILPAVLVLLPAASRGARGSLAALGRAMADRPLALSVATTAVQIAAQFATYALIALWLVEAAGAPEAAAPLALLLFGLGGVAGNLAAPPVERRLGADRTVTLCLLAMVGLFALLSAFPAMPLPAMLVLITLWSVFGLMYMAPLQTRLVRLAPERPGIALALNTSALYVGMAAGASVAGAVHAAAGAAALPAVSGVLAAAAAGVFALARRPAPLPAR